MKTIVLFFFLILAWSFGQGQLCTGSLGDPVIQITFGSGADPGPPLSAATTFYTYVGSDCPSDGQYTVRSNTVGCFNNSWHTILEDHTPNDVNGYFMLVNASYQPGDFYLDTVKGLCSKTTYQFSAWIVNVLKNSACGSNGIKPNLTFSIETTTGKVLQTYPTGNIPESPTPTWQEYGLFFETPANTNSVVVRLTNNAPGGCGNDLALDDISFRPCGPMVTAGLGAANDTAANVCEGDTTTFQLHGNASSGYSNPVYQWQLSTDNGKSWKDIQNANQTSYTRMPTGPGTYIYRLAVAESGNIGLSSCRVASNQVRIYVNALPVIQMDRQTNACLGSTVNFSASGASTYQWSGPDAFSSSGPQVSLQNVQFNESGIYRVLAVSDKGCQKMDSTHLTVNPNPVAGITGIDHLCEGTGVQLEASGGNRYAWTPAKGLSSATIADPVAAPVDTTNYKVVVYNQYGCSDSANILINVWKKPVANAGPDKKTKEGIPVTLDATVSGSDVSFFWTPPSFLDHPELVRPKATLTDDFLYTLTVVSNRGCGVSADQVFVKVYKNVIIPNAFSPNGDGINDTWVIRGLSSYPDADLQVFNRYGEMVYRSKSYNAPWNGEFRGKPLPVGTYYYVIDLRIGDPALTGWLLIIR